MDKKSRMKFFQIRTRLQKKTILKSVSFLLFLDKKMPLHLPPKEAIVNQAAFRGIGEEGHHICTIKTTKMTQYDAR